MEKNSLTTPIFLYDEYKNNGSQNFDIVHGYYDEYNEHLEIQDNLFIVAKNDSPKGINTIKVCKLYRLSLIEDKIKSQSSQSRGLLSAISQTNLYDDAIREMTLSLKKNILIYEDLNNILSSRILKDTVELIEYKEGHIYLNNETFDSVKSYLENETLIANFKALKKKLKTGSTFQKALAEYLSIPKEAAVQLDILKNNETISNFKKEYDNGRISSKIHHSSQKVILDLIENIYIENSHRIEDLLKFQDEYNYIKKLLTHKNIHEELDYLLKFKDPINKIKDFLELYKGTNDLFYCISFIPLLLDCADLIKEAGIELN